MNKLMKRVLLAMITTSFSYLTLSAETQTPLATLNGAAVTQQDILRSASDDLFRLEQELYSDKKLALTKYLEEQTFKAEAQSKGVTIHELREQEFSNFKKKFSPEYFAGAVAVINHLKSMDSEEMYYNLESLDSRTTVDIWFDSKFKEQLKDKFLKNHAIKIRLKEPDESDYIAFPAKNTGSFSIGKDSADTTIHIISNFSCGYCLKGLDTLYSLKGLKENSIRLEFIHASNDYNTYLLAKSAICSKKFISEAKQQSFYKSLFAGVDVENANLFIYEAFTKYGNESKRLKFQKCIESDNTAQQVNFENASIAELGIRYTPRYYIQGNGIRKTVSGYLTYEHWLELLGGNCIKSNSTVEQPEICNS